MAHEFKHPIIGQEAICPDGLGRVVAFEDNFPEQWIQIETYAKKNRGCKWAPHNVELIPLKKEFEKINNGTNKHIIVIGDPLDGDFIGPFDTLEQAQAYVNEDPEKNDTKFWIAELGFPAWIKS